MKKKIRTHKDAFRAYLTPEKYEIDPEESCVFCQLKNNNYNRGFIACEKYCSVASACIVVDDGAEQKKLIRYVLRYCKEWRVKNIRRLVIKKMEAMGY